MHQLRRSVKLIFSGLLFVFLVLFAISNREAVVIALTPLPWQFELPLFLFGLFMLLLGYLWGSLIAIGERYRVSRTVKKQTSRAAALEEEVASLRAERHMNTGSSATPSLPAA
jgi:uncharacterized integral membrane protein